MLTSPVPELVEEIATRIIVLHHGEILAFDTLDGLQRMTGCRGSLGDVLERLIFPDTTRKLDAYFQEFTPMIGRLRQLLPVPLVVIFCCHVPRLRGTRSLCRMEDRAADRRPEVPARERCCSIVMARVLRPAPSLLASIRSISGDYRKWLELSPWTVRKPLPVGTDRAGLGGRGSALWVVAHQPDAAGSSIRSHFVHFSVLQLRAC